MESAAERIAILAKQGLTAREIAQSVGVSRQRVYQIAKADGIQLRGAWATVGRSGLRGPTRAQSRLLTGGVPVPVSHSIAGTIAELLVAADLLARGWHAYIPITRMGGHDLIATKGDLIKTFEVRSAHRKPGGTGLAFGRSSKDRSDYYALVITGEPVVYQPALEAAA